MWTDEAIELLEAMIAIPSVNPTFGGKPADSGEARMGEFLAQHLTGLGADVSRVGKDSKRPNIVAWLPCQGGETLPSLVIAPHLDTVTVEGMTVPPFKPTRREGRIYGRGACDTKGPTAAALAAIRQWLRQTPVAERRFRLGFAALMGEEEGGAGSRELCEFGFKADFVMALEPTSLKVVNRAKGLLRLCIHTSGEAGHSSAPATRPNAIWKLHRVLQVIQQLTEQWAGRGSRKGFEPTLCPTLLKGGAAINIIPERANVSVDIRTVPGAEGPELLAEIKSALADLVPPDGIEILQQGPCMDTDEAHPWVHTLAQTGAGTTSVNWFSDANHFAGAGIPAVAFGPGSINDAHAADESIAIAELEQGAKAFLAFLQAVK